MTSKELKKIYLDYFAKKDHVIIPSAPLIPENDPSVLFTTAGMHPLVPYLLGEEHPEGNRLANVQKCLRTDDIDEVGDTSHHTFFEMLGNWSLGDYWKEEAIKWSYEFLIKELGLDHDRIWITCFEGDADAEKDIESAEIWEKIGISKERIFYYGKKENWWGPAGTTGPCGPDTEIFYDTSGESHGKNCKPGDNCGRFFEVWNNVFIQYNKTNDGKYEPLKQKNVDTGMGVDRTTAVVTGLDDDYKVEDLWGEIISKIESITKVGYEERSREQRIVADHLRASTFLVLEGIYPSNKERGYVLRRLIRRAIRFGKILGVNKPFISEIAGVVIKEYKNDHPKLKENESEIIKVLQEEEERFIKTLEKGLREIGKLETIDGKKAFFLYETYGFPLELTEEIAEEKGQEVNKKEFESEFEKHKKLSRSASQGMFKGGLADQGEETTKLHTATHLLHTSLRKILGDHVEQKGSNITSNRLRFDFSHPQKLEENEIKEVEGMINEQVEKDLPVSYKTMSYKEAVDGGALAFFREKYGRKVKVYTIGNPNGGWFSKEVCGGPHVTSTDDVGHVRIIKQEKIGANLMRLYATIETAQKNN